MWPFKKNRFKNLKREDVVNAIVELEKQEAEIEDRIQDKQKQIDNLIKKGRKEKTADLKLFYAKKIAHLQEEKKEEVNRGMYLIYNARLMNKLKNALDDNSFYLNAGKVSLSNLLADQANLAKFLNKALNTKVKSEDILTSADTTFNEIQDLYDENQTIYGVNKVDDEIMSLLETGDDVEDDEDEEIDEPVEASNLEQAKTVFDNNEVKTEAVGENENSENNEEIIEEHKMDKLED